MIKNILLISSLLASSLIAADKEADEWKVSGRLIMYLKSVDVVGGRNSSREGNTHNEILNLNFTGPLWDGQAGIQTRVRATNDRRIQKDGAELLYLRSYFKNKIWNLEAGDVAASLNPYIFGGSLKGIKAVYKSPEKKRTWDYSLISGFKKKSWRETYNTEKNEAYTSYVGAFEAKYRYERAKEISLSISGLKDDLSTGGDSYNSNGKKGFGFGVAGKWRFNRYVTLRGRSALTYGTDDLKHNTDSQSHNAILLKLLTRPSLRSVRSNFIYQRVSSDFISFGGRGNQDKEQLENSTTWRINKQFRARLDLKANRDNLDGALGATRNTYYETASLVYYPKFLKRANFNFKVSNKDRDGRLADNGRVIAGVNFNLRKKSGWRYGTGYEHSDYTDNYTTTSSQKMDNFKFLLGYRQKLSKYSSYRFTGRITYQDIKNRQDKIGFKLDAGYVYDKRLAMNLLYRINQTDRETENDSENSTYQFRAAYKLDAKGKNVVRLLLEKKDVEVENVDASTYNEYTGKLSLVINF